MREIEFSAGQKDFCFCNFRFAGFDTSERSGRSEVALCRRSVCPFCTAGTDFDEKLPRTADGINNNRVLRF